MDDLEGSLKKHILKQAEAIENFVACYLRETGLSPKDIVLIEKHSSDGLTVEWYCEPKKLDS